MSQAPRAATNANDLPAKGGKCPICGRPTVAATRPFCSRRCADIDLSRWFGGAYAVPAEEADDTIAPEPSILPPADRQD